MRMVAALGVVGLFGSAWLVGCGGSVDVDDGGDCEASPTCPAPKVQVEGCTNATCETVTTCGADILCEEPLVNCDAFPACGPNEVQVAQCTLPSCHEVSLCGTTILCEPAGTCLAAPACDPGDTQVGGASTEPVPPPPCPNGATCYTTSTCGQWITCIDEWPEQGCPPQVPTDGDSCERIAEVKACTYPTSPGCFEFYQCDLVGGGGGWAWSFVGGGCEDG